MDRRRLLEAISIGVVGGSAGCVERVPPVLLDGSVDFTVCGSAAAKTCGVVGIRTDLAAVDGDRSGNVVVRVAEPDRIIVIGGTRGIGDPTCRETFLNRITFAGSTLSYVVGNETDLPLLGGGCAQSRASNYYRLRVRSLGEVPATLSVKHFDRGHQGQQETTFETTVAL